MQGYGTGAKNNTATFRILDFGFTNPYIKTNHEIKPKTMIDTFNEAIDGFIPQTSNATGKPAKPVKKLPGANYQSSDRGGIAKKPSKANKAKLEAWLNQNMNKGFSGPPMGADGQYLNAISGEDKVYGANVTKLCAMVGPAQQKVNAIRASIEASRPTARPTVNLTMTRTASKPGNVAAAPNTPPGGGSGAGADGQTYTNATGNLQHDLAVAENELRTAMANCNKAQDAKRRWDAENSASQDSERAIAEKNRQNALAEAEKAKKAAIDAASKVNPSPSSNPSVLINTAPIAPVDMAGGGGMSGGGGGAAPEDPAAEKPTDTAKPKGSLMPMIIMITVIGGIIWYVNQRTGK